MGAGDLSLDVVARPIRGQEGELLWLRRCSAYHGLKRKRTDDDDVVAVMRCNSGFGQRIP